MTAPPPAPPRARPGCRPATAAGRDGRPGRPAPRPPGRRHTGLRTGRSAPRGRASPRPVGEPHEAHCVAVGVQRPADRADEHRDVPRGRGHRPGAGRADVRQRDPLAAGRGGGRARARHRRRGGARSAAASARAGRSCPPRPPRSTSGAASCTAPSIASRTVTVEDGQPWQEPSSRSRATPSRHAQVLHPAGVRAQVGPDLVQRPLDPGVHVQRVQPVQQQQALHQRVGGEPVHDRPARLDPPRPGRP